MVLLHRPVHRNGEPLPCNHTRLTAPLNRHQYTDVIIARSITDRRLCPFKVSLPRAYKEEAKGREHLFDLLRAMHDITRRNV